jgi:hypothetical protein
VGSTYGFTPMILQPHTTGALTLLISEVVLVSPKPRPQLRAKPKRKRPRHPDAKPKSKKPVLFNTPKTDELS